MDHVFDEREDLGLGAVKKSDQFQNFLVAVIVIFYSMLVKFNIEGPIKINI